MVLGYAMIRGNVRRPRQGATVYRRPELAVIFGALEANPGSVLFEGTVSDISSTSVWQGGLLLRGTFRADPNKPIPMPPMREAQRLGLALLCYMHMLAQWPQDLPAVQRWREWAQAWLDHRGAEAGALLAEIADLAWPYPGLKYLVQAGQQFASGHVLTDSTTTLIGQAMIDLVRIADHHALHIGEEGLHTIIQQGWTY